MNAIKCTRCKAKNPVFGYGFPYLSSGAKVILCNRCNQMLKGKAKGNVSYKKELLNQVYNRDKNG